MNQDWIGVGLVSATKSVMIRNKVFLYEPNKDSGAVPSSCE